MNRTRIKLHFSSFQIKFISNYIILIDLTQNQKEFGTKKANNLPLFDFDKSIRITQK